MARPSERERMLARIASESTEGPKVGPSDLRSPNALDPMAGATVEERISGIFEIISERVDSARRSAQIGVDSENGSSEAKTGESSENEKIASLISGFRVWSDGVSPETLILTLEARLFANDRLVSALTAQLVEHVVLGEDMRRQLAEARAKLDVDISPVMAKFMSRLSAAGVKGDHVRFLSKKRMMDVLAAIWGSTPSGIADRVGDLGDVVTDERPGSGMFGKEDHPAPTAGPGSPTVTPKNDAEVTPKGGDDGGFSSGGNAVSKDRSDSETAPNIGTGSDDSESLERVLDDSEKASGDASGLAGEGMADAMVDTRIVAPGLGDAEVVSDGGDGLSDRSGNGSLEASPEVSDAPVDPAPMPATPRMAIPSPIVPATWPYNPNGHPLERGQTVVDDTLPAAPSAKEDLVGTMLEVDDMAPIDIAGTGYVVVQWTPFNERDLEPRKFHLPSTTSMLSLALPGSEEAKAAKAGETNGDPASARRFVEMFGSRNGWTMSEEEVRLWLFVQHEARLGARGARSSQMLGSGGWFDGVRLPAPRRQALVRILRRADQGDRGRVPSVRELAAKVVSDTPV